MLVNITNFNGLSLEENVKNNFKQAGQETTLSHILQVRYHILILAQKFGLDVEQAATAALLHDISRLLPVSEYLKMAKSFELEILPEEEQLPDLLHQKLSRIIAVETFDITDKEVLNAIACHTTLRPQATTLDKILFLADKLSWDKSQQPAFMPLVLKQIDKSLDGAVYCYLFNTLYSGKPLAVIHPWLKKALDDLAPKALAS